MALNPRNSYISGFQLSVAADRLTVSAGPGVCYLPTSIGTMRMATDVSVSVVVPSPPASTWYNIYAYAPDAIGGVAIEASATAPSAPYQGTARTKLGDITRRYLGSVYVGSDGKIVPFLHTAAGLHGNDITYTTPLGQNGTAAPTLLGLFSVATAFDCSVFIPAIVQKLNAQIVNSSTAPVYIGNSGMGVALSATAFLLTIPGANTDYAEILTDTNRQFQYLYGGSLVGLLGGLTVRPRGYRYDR